MLGLYTDGHMIEFQFSKIFLLLPIEYMLQIIIIIITIIFFLRRVYKLSTDFDYVKAVRHNLKDLHCHHVCNH
jgi:hypothetical protein